MRVESRKTKVLFQPRIDPPNPLYKSRSQNINRKARCQGRTRMTSRGPARLSNEGDDVATSDNPESIIAPEESNHHLVPNIFVSRPRIQDTLVTGSSIAQDKVINRCLPYLTSTKRTPSNLRSRSIPKLEREEHLAFLESAIKDARFTAADASRPWVVYWSLTGVSLLGKNIEIYRERYVVVIVSQYNNLSTTQGGQHICAGPKCRWRLQWRSWPALPPSTVICCSVESCNGRRQRKLGFD